MTTTSKVLIDIMDELTEKDFKRFKWYMTGGKLKDIKSIPKNKLEIATTMDTVDLMVDQYSQDAGEVAETILRNIGQNNLAEQLKNMLSEVQDQETEEPSDEESSSEDSSSGDDDEDEESNDQSPEITEASNQITQNGT